MSTQRSFYCNYILIVSRINRSHSENERNFTDRKRDGIPMLLYFHALLKVIILDGCFSRFLNCTNGIKSIVCNGLSTPPQKHHPPLAPPPVNRQTAQAFLFRQSPPLYWFFVPPPLMSDFSVNPKNIKVFYP